MKQNYRDDVKEIVEDGIVQKTFIKVTPADAPLKEIFWFLRHLVEGWFATSVWTMLKTKKNFSASGTQTRREINLALEVAKELNEVTSNSSILKPLKKKNDFSNVWFLLRKEGIYLLK